MIATLKFYIIRVIHLLLLVKLSLLMPKHTTDFLSDNHQWLENCVSYTFQEKVCIDLFFIPIVDALK